MTFLYGAILASIFLVLGFPAAFGQAPTPGDPGTCFVIADEGNTPNAPGNGNATADTLYVIDRLTGLATLIGTTGTFEAEALTFDVINQILYTMEGGTLTSLDFANNGAATTIGPAGSGTAGGVTVLFDDLDGLEFDYSTSPPTLYATQRVDSPAADLLVQINPATGAIVPGAFPGGADYVAIGTTATEDNIDDIAIDCQTGIMYGILNNGDNGTVDQLVTIDKVTGAIANVAATGIFDMEGLAFGGDGVLFGSTGNNGDAPTTANSTYDLGTPGQPGFGVAANGIRVVDGTGTDIGFDFEGLACFIEEPELQISLGLVSGSSECDCNAQAQIIITAGGVTLSGINVVNDQLPGCNQVIPTLLPGQTFSITCPLTSTIVNTTTAAGTDCYNRTANANESDTLTVIGDTTPPAFVGVPATINIACGDPLPTELPTLADDCANPSQIGLSVTTTLICPDEIERVWTAIDICGNAASTTQTITITDYALSLTGVPANSELSCEDPIPGATVGLEQNCVSSDLAPSGTTVVTIDVVITNSTPTSVCYAITDEGLTGGAGSGATIDDALFRIDPATGIATSLGNTGTLDVEAMAIEPDNGTIYAFEGGTLVIIDPANVGTPTTVGAAGTTANGALGVAVTFDDLDGAAFDQTTTPATLYATQREAGNDLLVQIDPATGALVPGAFGGDDYVVIGSLGTLVNVDDIAIDPATGIMYGIFNDADNTTADELAIIDKANGGTTDVDPADNIGIFDVEGLDFDCDGILRGTTGNNGDAPTTANSSLTLGIPGQAGFGAAANINSVVDADGVTIGFDFEAFSCFCDVIETIETVTITTTNSVALNFTNDLVLTVAATTNVSADGCQTTIERVWTGTDACNNAVSATQTIIIVDDVAPTLSGVPADAAADCASIPAAPNVAAADTCSSVDIDLVTTNLPGICPNNYTLQRVWTAIDACGNSVSATQNVTVTDTTPPVLVGVPADAAADCATIPAAPTVTATDDCSDPITVTFAETRVDGTCPNNYQLVRVWSAMDECMNLAAATQTVTVTDTSAPVLVGVPADAAADCATIPAAPTVTATDDCSDPVTVTFAETRVDGTCPNNYQLVRVWSAMDECMNLAAATQTVTVTDTTPPVLVGAPADAAADCATIPAAPTVTATDDCSDPITVTFAETRVDGTCPNNYQLVRVWSAMDECMNLAAATQTVTVTDTTPPVLVGAPADAAADCATIPAAPTVTATDDCSDPITVTFAETRVDGTCPNNYQLVRVWSAMDECMNLAAATQTVTVTDTTPPVLVGAPADAAADCATIPAASTVTATDDCSDPITVTFAETRVDGTCPNNYQLVRVWSAMDECMNLAAATQTVTVTDTTPPVLVGAPADAAADCATIPAAPTVTATDDCSDPITVTFAETRVDGTCPNNYQLVRVWSAMDECMNLAAATQTVTVTDTTPPVLVGAPADAAADCATIPAASTVTATDDCSDPITVVFTESRVDGTCPNNYQLVRVWSAMDECMNTATATQTVTVTDTTAPILAGVPADLTVECDSVTPAGPVTATDDCEDPITVMFAETRVDGDCPNNYELVRVWTAMDMCNNMAAATQTVTVTDTTRPTIAIVTAQTLTGDENCEALVPALAPTVMDNCSAAANVTVTQTPAAGTTVSGMSSITLTATDECGNSTSTVVMVTVDCGAPAIDLSKTVYVGQDGGASCPGMEVATAAAGVDITYCFEVENTGAVTLTNVVVTDATIAMPPITIGTMTVGQIVTVFYDATSVGAFTNTANVTGNGPDGTPVDDIDPAEVIEPGTPNIMIVKTAGTAADGDVFVLPAGGGTVLYTFDITNTGGTFLSDITITDDAGTPADLADDITLTAADCAGLAGPLAPLGTVQCTLSLPITQDTVNTASTTGNPTEPDGTDIPGLTDPTDMDPADVVLEDLVSIGSTVFLDPNDNGIQETGEMGVSGVLVEVVDTNGTVVGSDTTDGSGDYFIGGLTPGDYIVQISTPPANAPTSSTPSNTGDDQLDGDDNGSQPGGRGTIITSGTITLTDNGEPTGETEQGGMQDSADDNNGDMTIDFGLVPLGDLSIGSTVFLDPNDNGVQDTGEAGIAGVFVEVVDTNGMVVGSDTTDASGDYFVGGLDEGDYIVRITTPPATAPTSSTPSATGDDQVDGDDNGSQPGGSGTVVSSGTITLTDNGEPTGETEQGGALDSADDNNGDMTIDFGFVPEPDLVSIGSTVFLDPNDNGVQDTGEAGIAGVFVEVVDTNGMVVGSDTTDASGDYFVGGLDEGDYIVRITTPPATAPTSSTPSATGDDQVDGDDNGSQPGGSGTVVTSGTITLTDNGEPTGETGQGGAQDSADDNNGDMTIDFGFVPEPDLVSIGSTVFLDPNDNGVQDTGESGIAGVFVEVVDTNGMVVGSDTTDSSGDYFVGGLDEGDYIVRITTPPATAPTSSTPSAIGDDQVDGDDNGDQPGGSGTVVTSGTITLTDNGEPTGEAAQGGAQDSADDNNGDMTIDFGFVPEPDLVSIGSTVFLDPNDNGVQDTGEAGIAGVFVEVVDTNGMVVGSDTTDASGDYFVGGLAEGDYVVRIVTPPAAAPTSSTPSATGDDQVDGDDNGDQPGGSGTVVTSGTITLTDNGEPTGEAGQGGAQDSADDNNGDMTIDFGFVPVGEVSIGSTVFIDPNDNGVQDAGEAGIPGVLVEVLDATSGAVVGSDTTDAMGDYFVGGLDEGDYIVRITTPPATAPTSSTPSATGDDEVDGDDNGEQLGGSGTVVNSGTITLTDNGEPTGETGQGGMQDTADDDNGDMTIDFGFVPDVAPEEVSIGSTVFLDVDDNGIQDAGEMGIPGVLVEVLDSSGAVVGSDTTDSAGDYFIGGLDEGTYTVRITTPPPSAPDSSTPTSTGDDQVDGDDNGDQPGGSGTPVTSGPITLMADTEPTGEAAQGGTQDVADDNNGDMTIDFGFVPSAEPDEVSIGSTVFIDPNDNGVQDVGEAGIPGVLVEVLDATSGAVVGSDTTDAMGDYFVGGLDEGDYIVRITTPPASAPTSSTPSATGDDQVDGDDNGEQLGGSGTVVNSGTITLTDNGEPTGETGQGGMQDSADDDNGDMTIDFGFVPEVAPEEVSIGSTVFLDVDDNGIQDAGEMGIPGVLVEVLDSSGAVVGSDTTDSAGDYFIGGLDEGTYTVRITTPPPSAPDSSTPTSTGDDQVDGDDNGDQPGGSGTPVTSGPITLMADTEPTGEAAQGGTQDVADDNNGDMTIDFGFVPSAEPDEVSIGSTVFIDPNDNGVQDVGEAGIPGVLVEVLDATSGAVVGSDTTDAMGDYFVGGLDEGDYIVRITTPPASAPTSSTPSATGDDQVDGDDNGEQLGGSGTVVNSGTITLTDNGEPTGETGQGGMQDSADDDNGDMTIDFGFVPDVAPEEVSIGSTVFLDVDDNGIQDAGEMGIPGVLVEVLDSTGAVVGSDTTDSAGDYFIGGLDEGTYTVRITTPPPSAPTSSTPSATGDDGIDSDDNGDQPGGAGTPVTSGMITLMAGTEPTGEPGQGGTQDAADDDNGEMTIDFGFVPPPPPADPVSIGSTVFLDSNDNGIQDAGEMGVTGVLVEILDASGAVVGSDVTDGMGDYFVGNLAEGTYIVRITTPPASSPSSSTSSATGDDQVDGDDNGEQLGGAGTPITSGAIVLMAGTEPTGETGQGGMQDAADDDAGDMTIDFGLVPLGSIAGNVGEDTDDDDAPNAPIPMVTIQLLNSTGAVIDTMVTDAMGNYLFTGLPAGDYTVVELQPAGLLDVTEGDTVPDATDSTMAPDAVLDNMLSVTLAEGEDDVGNNFVEEQPPELGSIAGNVGEDTDDDDAPNAPIPMVTIQLLDSTGAVIDTMVTDAMGNYLFTGLPAGDYTVVELQPAGLLDVTEGDTVPDATDSTMAPDAVLDNMLSVTLAEGEDDVGNNFVEEQPPELGSIAGNVGEDTDDDDAPNAPIPMVTIQLLDSTGAVIDTTMTDALGNYVFTGLPAGNYTVVEQQPAGFNDVTEGDTAPDASDSTMAPDATLDNMLSVTLAEGEEDLGNDFVEEAPTVSVGSSFFLDVNDNGIQDPGEAGIPGVGVEVYAAGDTPGVDTPAGSATSDSSGFFFISGLPEGDYFLYIPTPPASSPTSSTPTDTADNQVDGNDNGDQPGGSGTPIISPVITLTAGGEPAGETGLGGNQDASNDTNGDMTIDFGFVPAIVPVNPAITVEKTTNGEQADTGTGPLVPVGSTVTWTYTVTNPGDVDLANVMVNDSDIGLVCTIALLPAGGMDTCTATGVATEGQYENIGTASGAPVDAAGNPILDGNGNPVPTPSDTDPSHYFGVTTGIDIDKTVILGTVPASSCPGVESVTSAPGAAVTYCITVRNTGNVALSNVAVTDPLIGFSDTIALLAAGGAQTFAVPDTINGSLVNTATATGNPTDPAGNDIPGLADPTNSDTAQVQEQPPINIGNFVWNDDNGNGINDPGEAGVPNVQVILQNVNGDVVQTTSTDAAGEYNFTVPQGEYRILFNPATLPANFTFTSQNVGNDNTDSDVNPSTGLTPLTEFLTADNFTFDAGIIPLPGSIGDVVWNDFNQNGVPDEDLSIFGLSGVRVNLLDSLGNVIDTTVSGLNGSYLFTDLPPGTYTTEIVRSDVPGELTIDNTVLTFTSTIGPGESVGTHDYGFSMVPTAIELEYFEAVVTETGVTVSWATAWEQDSLGYILYRVAGDGSITAINETIILATGGGSEYGLTIDGATGGRYILEEIETDLDRTFQSIIAYARVDATAIGVPTRLDVQAENEAASLVSSADYNSYLVSGFTVLPQVLDLTDPDNPRELVGDILSSEAGNAAYFSAPAGLQINIQQADEMEEE